MPRRVLASHPILCTNATRIDNLWCFQAPGHAFWTVEPVLL